jgi:hypothetical protein
MRRLTLTIASILAATLVAVGLQTATPQEGTETIGGTVTRADTGGLLQGVRLELVDASYQRLSTGYEKPCKPEPKSESSESRRFTATDDKGKFTFTGIVPGEYYLYAEHEGFLKFAYGQHGVFPIPRVLRIGVQESMEAAFSNPNIPREPPPPAPGTRGQQLPPGEPPQQQRPRGTRGQPSTSLVPPPPPGNRGEQLPPGTTAATVDYTSTARPPALLLQNLQISMTPAPTIVGMVVSEKGAIPASSVQIYQYRYTPLNGRTLKSVRATLTDDEGKYRLFWLDPGRYIVAGGYSDYGLQPWKQGLLLTPNLPNPDSGYPMIYYPSSTTASNAVYVPLNPGSEPIIDVLLRSRLRLTARVRLTGESIPGNASLVVVPSGGDLCAAVDFGITAQRDGVFEIRDIPEGIYAAVAMSGRDFISDLVMVKVEDGAGNETSIPVTASTTVRGSLVLPEQTGASRRVWNLSHVRVNLIRKGQELHHAANALVDAANGNFSIPGVGPGTYYATVDNLPPGLYVENIKASKFDINDREKCSNDLDAPNYKYMDIHGHLDAVQALVIPSTIPVGSECLTITVSPGSPLFGYVYDPADRAVSGAFVVAVPKGMWEKSGDGGVTPADRILTGTTDSVGHFVLYGTTEYLNPLPAKKRQEYRLYAFESIDPNEIYDPGFTERFQGRETFEARHEVFENGSWKRRFQILKVAGSDTCDTENAVERKRCFLTAIPASETATLR